MTASVYFTSRTPQASSRDKTETVWRTVLPVGGSLGAIIATFDGRPASAVGATSVMSMFL